jgi:hypothetical protein
MSNQVDFLRGISRPKIDGKNEEGGVDFIYILDFLSRHIVVNDESNARWWGNGASILVAETTHASSNWLLSNLEAVSFAIIHRALSQLYRRRLRNCGKHVAWRSCVAVREWEVVHGKRWGGDGSLVVSGVHGGEWSKKCLEAP